MFYSSTERFVTLEMQQDDERDEDDQAGHDAIDYRTSPVSSDKPDGQTNPEQSSRNRFADSRNFVRQLCDASLLAANVSQLRAVLDNGSGNAYFVPLLIMIAMSIVCHLLFGFLMIQRWRKEREAQIEHRRNDGKTTTPTANPQGKICFCTPCVAVERYDEISMYFMFLVVILNVGIAGLGLSGPEKVSI